MITIRGSTPSQKNSKQIFINRATGKPFITSSVKVKAWQQDALWQLKGVKPIVDYPVCLTMTFYYDSKRRHDLDNSSSGVLDILVKAGILVDDDVAHVDQLELVFGGYDKTNARVEILISPQSS